MFKSVNTDNISDEKGLLEQELVILKEELERAKRTIALQQECLFAGYRVEEFVKCLLCEKIFTNNSFLEAHTRRRHQGAGEKEARRVASKETQTEHFYPGDEDPNIKRSASFSEKEEEFHEHLPTSQTSLSVKNRKVKKSLKGNFSSIGKKLNKILKKK